MYDLPRLTMKKIIIDSRENRVIVYFSHSAMLDKSVMTASMAFYLRDRKKWHVGYGLFPAPNVEVDKSIEQRIKEQLVLIFGPYFIPD